MFNPHTHTLPNAKPSLLVWSVCSVGLLGRGCSGDKAPPTPHAGKGAEQRKGMGSYVRSDANHQGYSASRPPQASPEGSSEPLQGRHPSHHLCVRNHIYRSLTGLPVGTRLPVAGGARMGKWTPLL